MDWADYYTSLTTMLQVADPDGQTNLNLVLRRLIDEVELYIFRHPKLDFLVTKTEDWTQQTVGGSRTVPIPRSFIVVEDVALITPSGKMPHDTGATHVQLLRTTRNFITMTWPTVSMVQAPKKYETYWAIFSMQQQATTAPDAPSVPTAGVALEDSPIYIGPTPDGSYTVDMRGTYRPPRFYDVAGFDPTANDETTQFAATPSATCFLTWWNPDLYLAASMVFGAGYQKNFGAQADDPRSAVSWTANLERLIGVASSEEFRKKAQGWNWGSHVMPDGAVMAPAGAGPQMPPPTGQPPAQ